MKNSARIQGTIDLLSRIYEGRVPMDTTCGDYFRHRRYIGSKDRKDIVERVYEVMRMHARIGFVLKELALPETPRARLIAFLMLKDGNPQQIKDTFNGEKYAPEPLDLVEQKFVNEFKAPKYPEAVQVECPPEFEDRLRNIFQDDFMEEMSAMLEPATLDLRVNLFKSTREKAKNYLEADGVKTTITEFSPWGLRCENKAYLSRTKAFAKGWVEIQDEGSQLISYLCGAEPGMQVLDYCAGAGGKTLGLAAAMQNKGRIVAMDLDTRRLMKSRERIKKAGCPDIVELRPLCEDKHKKWLKRQKGSFDVVLTDVPCSGTGTWRRNPDMRWRTYGPEISELTEIQADILNRVAHTVKVGGKLLYATCSLLEEENEAQVEKFLKEHSNYKLVSINTEFAGDMMRLTPHKHKTDGFFTAVMTRES